MIVMQNYLDILEATVTEKDAEISQLCNEEMEKDLRLQAQHSDFQAQLSAEQMAREQVTNTLEANVPGIRSSKRSSKQS